MKYMRQSIMFVFCCCLVLLPCVSIKVRAQQAEKGKKVFDTYSTTVGMAYPAAGAVFKATGEMLDLFGYFGKNADPAGEAIKRINERLDFLEKRVSDLETKVRAIENELFRTQNMTRVRLLRSKQDALKLLAYKLQQKPTEQGDKQALAKEAQIIAGGFLDDPDLWMWSDMREKDGAMLPADFKPLPALEYYVVALVAWIAAIDSASDGDVEFVNREHGRALQKHIAYLSVSSGWKESDGDAETLPEKIMARVSCSLESIRKSPDANTRKCTIHEGCEDRIARLASTVAIHEEVAPLGTEICNVAYSERKMGSEDELERMYGIEMMEKLAQKLTRLKDFGTVREQFVGTFDPSTQTAQYLYGVKPNGDLLWYMHRVVTRNTDALPSETQGQTDKDRVRKPGPRAQTPAGKADTVILNPNILLPTGVTSPPKVLGRVKIPSTGTPPISICDSARRARARNSPAAPGLEARCRAAGVIVQPMESETVVLDPRIAEKFKLAEIGVTHVLDGPKRVGTGGWQNFREVMPAGLSGIYALTREGVLKWYRHDGFLDGSVKWDGSREVGRGWGDFQHIIPMGDGIIYAITKDGRLEWRRHAGYLDGRGLESPGAWEGPKNVGTGWGAFKQVFAGGEGVIYAVTSDGVLKWYRNKSYMAGVSDWEGPKDVGAGWQDFKTIFSPGEGIIYAMKPTGEILWYKHDGYKDGSARWQSPVVIAADWKEFLFVFPRMTGTYAPPVVR